MAGYYDETFIEEVRSSNDIVEVVSEYVKLDKKGKDFWGLCPFHREKTPSFSVVPAKQIYYCFGCGKGGNILHFIMETERMEFGDALKYLAQRAGIAVPALRRNGGYDKESEVKKEILEMNKEAARFYFACLNNAGKGASARKYLQQRQLTERTVRRFGLGYAPGEWHELLDIVREKGFSGEAIDKSGLFRKNNKGEYYDGFRNRLMFPIFNVTGSVIAFGGRRINEEDKAKYINSPETAVYTKGRHLYGLNFVRAQHLPKLIVVEGYMDVVSLNQAGCVNIVASLGTALTEAQGRLLKKYTEEIIICYDADAAGQAATLRGLDLLKGLGCKVKVLSITDGKDPDEFVKANGLSEFEKLIERSETLVDYKIRRLRESSDVNSVQGSTEFFKGLADILAEVEVSVERELYLRRAANEFNVKEEHIQELINEKTNVGKVPGISSKVGNIRLKSINRAGNDKILTKLIYDERLLLAFLCMDKRMFSEVKNELPQDDYASEENREAADIIYREIEKGGEFTPAHLLDRLSPEQAGIFTGLFRKDCICDDIKTAMKEKLTDIKIGKTEIKIQQLLDEISNTGSTGERSSTNENAVNEEKKKKTEELNELVKVKNKLKSM